MTSPWNAGFDAASKRAAENHELGIRIIKLITENNLPMWETLDLLCRVTGSFIGPIALLAPIKERPGMYAIPHILLATYAKEPNFEKYMDSDTLASWLKHRDGEQD